MAQRCRGRKAKEAVTLFPRINGRVSVKMRPPGISLALATLANQLLTSISNTWPERVYVGIAYVLLDSRLAETYT